MKPISGCPIKASWYDKSRLSKNLTGHYWEKLKINKKLVKKYKRINGSCSQVWVTPRLTPMCEIFETLFKVKVLIERLRKVYNAFRPDSVLAYLSPAPEVVGITQAVSIILQLSVLSETLSLKVVQIKGAGQMSAAQSKW